MYHVMRNSMAAERKHALKDGHRGVIWVTQKAGQRSCHHPGVMRNVTDHWVHPAPHPSHSWGTVPLTASSAAVHDSAHVLRGAAGRFGGASPLRGAQIEGPCARVGAATRARSRALALGMRGAHAVVVCGQGIDRHLRFLAMADEKDAGAHAPSTGLISPQDSTSGAGGVAWLRYQPVELTAVLGGFGLKPLAEGDDLRQFRDGLRADDPIRVGHRHGDVEWTDKPPADQIPCRQCGASERYALPINRGIDRHACLIENGAARWVDGGDAGKVEPLPP